MNRQTFDVVVVGGGAGGFFSAIQLAERRTDLRIAIVEQSKEVLQKVRISGGGRCNVTHGCFEPQEMVKNYPRGRKELIGPFHRFLCGDMMEWLESHGVSLKIEDDGRVFPTSDNSGSITGLFQELTKKCNIQVLTEEKVISWEKIGGNWKTTTQKQEFISPILIVAAGSSQFVWNQMKKLGHTIVPPVPSLFTFKTKHPLIDGLMGLSFQNAEVTIPDIGIAEFGPVLITHWGLSGPAVLKLSARGARELNQKNYALKFSVNWLALTLDEVVEELKNGREQSSKKKISGFCPFDLPKRFWHRALEQSSASADLNWGDISNTQIRLLAQVLTSSVFQMQGKTTFKEEFVTAGGVETSEVDFRTMESKIQSGLYFIGETLNIDGVTGGYNFQAVWTESVIAAEAISAINGN